MQIGYTGKLPAYGDFVQGGGSLRACQKWSEWAESGLAACRGHAGFADTFLTSPIWRFAVADHVFGDAPVAGVFCPSMDKVGRLFPFAVVTELTEGVTPMAACGALTPWFERVEAAVLAALDPEATTDALARAIDDPAPLRGKGTAHQLASTPGIGPLSVNAEGEPIADTGMDLDLSDDEPQAGDGAWIALGGIDGSAQGVTQYGTATDALFARLVTGGDAHEL